LETLKLITLKKHHLFAVAPPSPWFGIDTLYKGAQEHGPAFTLEGPEGVIACGGVVVLHPGVGEAWFLPGASLARHVLEVVKYIKCVLQESARHLHLHRIQAHVVKEATEAYRWAQVLGFTGEGLLRCYGIDGKDYYVMAYMPRKD
jgi:hypothetical protein